MELHSEPASFLRDATTCRVLNTTLCFKNHRFLDSSLSLSLSDILDVKNALDLYVTTGHIEDADGSCPRSLVYPMVDTASNLGILKHTNICNFQTPSSLYYVSPLSFVCFDMFCDFPIIGTIWICDMYPLDISHSHGQIHPFFIGKPSINGPSIPWLC